MKERTSNPHSKSFSRYGGRGIKVCNRWKDSFENFLTDMGHRPKGYSIDRINNDGDYEPSNCRWANHVTQARNRRNNIIVTHNGKEMCLAELATIVGLPYGLLFERHKSGLTGDQLLRAKKPTKERSMR